MYTITTPTDNLNNTSNMPLSPKSGYKTEMVAPTKLDNIILFFLMTVLKSLFRHNSIKTVKKEKNHPKNPGLLLLHILSPIIVYEINKLLFIFF